MTFKRQLICNTEKPVSQATSFLGCVGHYEPTTKLNYRHLMSHSVTYIIRETYRCHSLSPGTLFIDSCKSVYAGKSDLLMRLPFI